MLMIINTAALTDIKIVLFILAAAYKKIKFVLPRYYPIAAILFKTIYKTR